MGIKNMVQQQQSTLGSMKPTMIGEIGAGLAKNPYQNAYWDKSGAKARASLTKPIKPVTKKLIKPATKARASLTKPIKPVTKKLIKPATKVKSTIKKVGSKPTYSQVQKSVMKSMGKK